MAVGDVALTQDIATFGFSDEQCISLLSTFGYLCYIEPVDQIISNHCELALDRLAEQFKKTTDFHSIICAFVEQLQILEFAFVDLVSLRGINSAIGVQLDGIGEIVGLSRFTDDDDSYRAAIRLKIGQNTSSGSPEDVISFVQQQTGAFSIDYAENYPAKISMHIVAPTASIPNDLILATERVCPAGVGVLLTHNEPGGPFFAYDAEGVSDPDGAGFSEPGITNSGGKLAELVGFTGGLGGFANGFSLGFD